MKSRLTILLLVLIAAFGLPAQGAPELLDSCFRADTAFPEFARFWSDSSQADSQAANEKLGGSLHVYLRNTGAGPMQIQDVLLDGISLKQAIAYSDQRKFKKVAFAASLFFSKLPQADRDRLVSMGEPIWWKADPSTIKPGETAEVVVRLRRVPRDSPIKLAVASTAGASEAAIPTGVAKPRIESIGFPAGLDRVCAYFSSPIAGNAPVKVLMDGEDVTGRCIVGSDPKLGISPVVVRLSFPVERGSFHCFQGIYADGSKATAGIRAYDDELGYGLWGARPGGEDELDIGREHVRDMGLHNINVQMPILGSGAVAKFMTTDEGRRLMARLGIRRILDEPEKSDQRFAFYLADEPDTADFKVQGVPAQSKVGCLGQGLLKRADDLRAADPLTPSMVNVNMTFKPHNWHIYGQLPDYFAADPYYQTRLAQAYWNKPDTIPVYSKCTFVHAVASVCNSACSPRPLHIMLNSVRSQKGDKVFRWGTREEKRIELYYALAAGAKQISYWWFLPIKPGADGANGCGADHPQARALWNEIGLLGAEVRTAGPIITTGCPAALDVRAPEKLWVRTLIAGTDTAVILCVNDDYTNDQNGTSIRPVGNAEVSVALPAWLEAKSVFEIDLHGVQDVKWDSADRLSLRLGTVKVTRMVVITSDESLRERISKRYAEGFSANVAKLLSQVDSGGR